MADDKNRFRIQWPRGGEKFPRETLEKILESEQRCQVHQGAWYMKPDELKKIPFQRGDRVP